MPSVQAARAFACATFFRGARRAAGGYYPLGGALLGRHPPRVRTVPIRGKRAAARLLAEGRYVASHHGGGGAAGGIRLRDGDVICPTLPVGSVAVEADANERGERVIWLAMADRLGAMRGLGESYSDVIMRIAAAEGARA